MSTPTKPAEWVSLTRYAQLCGIDRQTVYNRIATGVIAREYRPTGKFGTLKPMIDVVKYPPVKPQNAGNHTAARASRGAQNPTNPADQ